MLEDGRHTVQLRRRFVDKGRPEAWISPFGNEANFHQLLQAGGEDVCCDSLLGTLKLFESPFFKNN